MDLHAPFVLGRETGWDCETLAVASSTSPDVDAVVGFSKTVHSCAGGLVGQKRRPLGTPTREWPSSKT